ncbi:MAG TPA: DUF6265 family protein [Pyrinomonadaceae bacterium]|nr:DUF6265 family protein [Pyrinomonadaceae bacterium]
MIFKRMVLPVFALIVFAGSGLPQSKVSVAEMSWMSGCWQGRKGNAVIEEIWSKPAGGSMLGLGRTVNGTRTVFFEFMQFREENGNLVFRPQPQGNPPVSFPLKDSFGGKATFENLKHDFPQRVIYERKGKALMWASIEGMQNGKAEREEFVMHKVRCN